MAATFTMKQVPLGLLRRQTPTSAITRRFASTLTQTPGGYPLYPSVSSLLLQKGIPDSEISKIPATGPKGRLLKGDVLAYIGEVAAGYPAEQAARIEKMGHLDLSNIKIAPPPAPPAPEAAAAPAREEPTVPELPSDISIAVSISLESVLATQKRIKDALGVTVPLSTFIARATELANDDLPRSAASAPSASELFDELLGAAPIKFTRGNYVPEINTVPLDEFETFDEDLLSASTSSQEVDIIDILSGKVSPRTYNNNNSNSAYSVETTPAPSALNVFSLTVPVSEQRRAKIFLDRLNTVLTVDPGRLVL